PCSTSPRPAPSRFHRAPGRRRGPRRGARRPSLRGACRPPPTRGALACSVQVSAPVSAPGGTPTATGPHDGNGRGARADENTSIGASSAAGGLGGDRRYTPSINRPIRSFTAVGVRSSSYERTRISFAARSPERTAPSIPPYDVVAVSVPAQWIRPNGSRSSDPYLVRIPGDQCAMEQPRVHLSCHQGGSVNSNGEAGGGPKRFTKASTRSRRRSLGSSASIRSATGPKVNEAMTPGRPAAGVASSVTSAGDPGPADCPLKPPARQNGSS